MVMRPFTPHEEQALLAMAAAPARAWWPIPPAPGKCPYNRLAALGCAQVLVEGPARKARLTATGRYFAGLVKSVGRAEPGGKPHEECADEDEPPNKREATSTVKQRTCGNGKEKIA